MERARVARTGLSRTGVRLLLVLPLVGLLVLAAMLAGAARTPDPAGTPLAAPSRGALPYAGTNYYAPVTAACPFYSSWSPACYGGTRRQIDADMRALERAQGEGLHRLWISLDHLFACFDRKTGFCGYDRRALAGVTDTLRLMRSHGQKAVLVLFALPHRPSDVDHFRIEALDGRHPQMRANYIRAAEQFVAHVAGDPVAASAVAVVDLQNEGYFQNRRALRERDTRCGDDGDCIDRELSKPFFTELHRALAAEAPAFPYTVSAVGGEFLGDLDHWIAMYPVDVYDLHLYDSDPAREGATLAGARRLPKPWFAGEVGTSNTDHPDRPCYTYDGDDPCTAAVATWWRKHLGPDYGARAVLIEHAGAVLDHSSGTPELTLTGRALARLADGR
jgi:hypothetical protein